jgi:hypothetical protein
LLTVDQSHAQGVKIDSQQFYDYVMSALMMPAPTMTTMTNTAPIAVSQPKPDPAKMGLINNNKQGKTC